MRYDAMLAEFNNAGGTHRIVSRTSDKAEIELTLHGQKYSESYTWAEAQEDGLPFGKENKVKKNWSTPRGRKQMLWARVVSEAVRALLPGVNCGRYAPEEIGEEAPAPATNGKAKSAADELGEVVDGEFQIVDDSRPATTVVDVSPAAPVTQSAPCTTQQSTRIRELFAALQLTKDQCEKALAKRGANVVRNLTSDAADNLIAALESKLNETANAMGGESAMPADATSWPNNGPCSDVQVAAIKQQMVQLQDPAIVEQVKKHLAANGKAKIADLTMEDADVLLRSLNIRNLEAFIGKSLGVATTADPSKN